MDIRDIISDAFVYPARNYKALILYMIISIVGFVLGGSSLFGMIVGNLANKPVVAQGFGIIGILIWIITALLISGYALDIVKFGIERRDDYPWIDFKRQVVNAIKLIVVGIFYYIVPAIIIWLMLFLLGHGILTIIITVIVAIVFVFAEFMAKCRLAKTDSLNQALSIQAAIGELPAIGMIKILATVIIVLAISFVLFVVAQYILQANQTAGEIIMGILSVYFIFFYNRAIGLLYSQV